MKTFCFKLYQSQHNNRLHRLINLAGLAYNHCIALHRRYYRLFGKYIHKFALQKHITKLKRTNRFAFMRLLNSQALQDVIARVDRAYNLFWANLKRKVKCSPPKFKAVRRYQSFTLHQHGWKLDEVKHSVYICGHWYGYFFSRKISGKVKAVTVKRDRLGDFYIYIACDTQSEQVKLRSGKSVGLDFGLKTFLTASDGNDVISPEFFRKNARIIRRLSRKLSRTQKTSRNHERARKNLARAYRRISNLRTDFHYKTARKLCERYAVICLETLNLRGMRKLWGRKINDLCFYAFVKILEWEALKFGTRIVFVPQFFPSSQLCHVCGFKYEGVKDLRVREWDCPQCGSHHDRDRNAAINILRGGASSHEGEPVRPEQSGRLVESAIQL